MGNRRVQQSVLGFYSIEIHCGGYVVSWLHGLLEVSFKAFLEMARDVLRFKTLHIEHGVSCGVVVVVKVDGDLARVLLPISVSSVVRVLFHNLHLQLGCALLF